MTTTNNGGGLFGPLNIANLLNNLNNNTTTNNTSNINAIVGTSIGASFGTNSSVATTAATIGSNNNTSNYVSASSSSMDVQHAHQHRWSKAQVDAAVAAATILLAITNNGNNETCGREGGPKQKQQEGRTEETTAIKASEWTMSMMMDLDVKSEETSNSRSTPVAGLSNMDGDEEREGSSPKGGNQWVHLGTFDSETEMQIVRNKEKVSKRRTEQLKNGVKIRYRCNTWKRTKCGFQMFSFQHADSGLIELYECGSHDHSGRRKIEYDLLGPLARRKATPLPVISGHKVNNEKNVSGKNVSSLQKPPKQLRMMAEQRALTEMAVAAAASASLPIDQIGKPWPFSLTESAKLDELRTLGRQCGLRLERNSDTQLSIYRLSINGGRGAFLLVIVDSADAVTLTAAAGAGTIFSPSGGGQQRWGKADWTQFLWAIRALFAQLMNHCVQVQQQQ